MEYWYKATFINRETGTVIVFRFNSRMPGCATVRKRGLHELKLLVGGDTDKWDLYSLVPCEEVL